MLRAAYRVLQPGGVICFLVIAVTDELSDGERTEAVVAGPAHVVTEVAYPDLMAVTGFTGIDVFDATGAYLETLTAWKREWEAASAELKRVVGRTEFTEPQKRRARAIRAVLSGLLRRWIVTGTRSRPTASR